MLWIHLRQSDLDRRVFRKYQSQYCKRQGYEAHRKECAPPPDDAHHDHKRRLGEKPSHTAHKDRKAAHGGKILCRKPIVQYLQDGKENHGHPNADQKAAGVCHGQIGRIRKQDGCNACQTRTAHHRKPWPQLVHQHSGWYLHGGIGIEIHGSQISYLGRTHAKGALQIPLDGTDGKSLKENHQIDPHQHNPNQPSVCFQLAGIIHLQSPFHKASH